MKNLLTVFFVFALVFGAVINVHAQEPEHKVFLPIVSNELKTEVKISPEPGSYPLGQYFYVSGSAAGCTSAYVKFNLVVPLPPTILPYFPFHPECIEGKINLFYSFYVPIMYSGGYVVIYFQGTRAPIFVPFEGEYSFGY